MRLNTALREHANFRRSEGKRAKIQEEIDEQE
jgi:hypothetical protein